MAVLEVYWVGSRTVGLSVIGIKSLIEYVVLVVSLGNSLEAAVLNSV